MKALLIVDMQNDFMPGGALGVPGADQIVATINALMSQFSLVVATQDWHPRDHGSFAVQHPGKRVGEIVDLQGIAQILWPVHCVQHTKGAELVPSLQKEGITSIFYKGTDIWIDSYSAFFDNAKRRATGLSDYLRSHHVGELYVTGVATDYCVLYTVLDALDLGFKTFLITDACRGIDLKKGDVEKALSAMTQKKARLITSKEVLAHAHNS